MKKSDAPHTNSVNKESEVAYRTTISWYFAIGATCSLWSVSWADDLSVTRDNLPQEITALQGKIDCYHSGKCNCPTEKIHDKNMNSICGNPHQVSDYTPALTKCQDDVQKLNNLIYKYDQDVDHCRKIGSGGD